MSGSAWMDELRAAVAERAHAPGDDGYAGAAALPLGASRADVIVRAASVDDVVAAVRHAARLDAEGSDAPVVIVSGGHSHWADDPGGVLLDLRDLDAVEIDGTLVRVGGGAAWGAVADALAPHGLVVSSGDTRSVGVGGLALGGGCGWFVRELGLALDQLESAQVVTAAGEVVETSASERPELFWALRGGGGNFGVVTRFDFRAREIPRVVHGELPVTGDLRAVLRGVRDVMRGAPDALTVGFLAVPPGDPTAPAGASLGVVWAGPDDETARAALAPLLEIEGLGGDGTGGGALRETAYADVLLDGPPEGVEMPEILDANGLVRELADDVIDAFCSAHEHAAGVGILRFLGGAYARVPSEATAWAHREAEALVIVAAFLGPGDDPERRDGLRARFDALEGMTLGAYGNFTNSIEPEVVARMYPAPTATRLAAIKRAWDPHNLFRRNHNILPSG